MPRDLFDCEHPEHRPRCAAAAHREREAAARRDRSARLGGDDLRRSTSDRIHIRQYFDLHITSPMVEATDLRLLLARFLDVSAELVAHRGEQLVLEISLATRIE